MAGGKKVAFVVVKDGAPPGRCRSSALAAAARGAGFEFSCEHPFLHWIEKTAGGAVRQVTWTFDGTQKVTLDGEAINFATFRERFESDEWVSGHPDSSIARFRQIAEGLQFWMNGILAEPPHAMVRRGKRFALIPMTAPAEARAKMLAELNS
jgi:hypothetical protein